MKSLWKVIGSFLKFAFATGVILFVSTLTYKFAGRVYPDDNILQIMLLLLFDGAGLVWFVTFKDVADGTLQRAIAGVMFFISLLAILLIVAAETITGDAADMAGITVGILRSYATWAIVLLAFLNAAASYMFYLTHPTVLKQMQEAYEKERQREHESKMLNLQMDIKEEILKETESAMREEAKRVAKQAARSLMENEMQTFYSGIGVKKLSNGTFVMNAKWSDPDQATTPALPGEPIPPPASGNNHTGYHRHTRTNSASGWKIPDFISKKILTAFICPHCKQEAVMSNLNDGTMKCNSCGQIVALAPASPPTPTLPANGNGNDPNAPIP